MSETAIFGDIFRKLIGPRQQLHRKQLAKFQKETLHIDDC